MRRARAFIGALEALRPLHRQIGGRFGVMREEIAHHALSLVHDPHHAGMAVHARIEETFDRRVGLLHGRRERDQRTRGAAHLLARRLMHGDTAFVLGDDILDHARDEAAHRLVHPAVFLDAGIFSPMPRTMSPTSGTAAMSSSVNRRRASRRRCRGVVGDVVGQSRDLRFGARLRPQFQILDLVVDDQSLRHAMLPIAADRGAFAIEQRPVVLDQAFERFPGQFRPSKAA